MTRIVNQVRKTSKRDNEIVQGWTSYHRIAGKIALRYLSYYFPTREDLYQAAALAATVAHFGLGEEARMAELTKILRRTLKQQATAYGMKQRQIRLPNGRKTMQTYRPEMPFAAYEDELEQEPHREESQEWFESRMMIVGVGEWTRRQANQFNDRSR